MKLWRWLLTAWLVAIFPLPLAFGFTQGGSIGQQLQGVATLCLVMAIYTIPFVLVCGLVVWLLKRFDRRLWLVGAALLGAVLAGLPLAAGGAIMGGGASLVATWLEVKTEWRWRQRLALGAAGVAIIAVMVALIPNL